MKHIIRKCPLKPIHFFSVLNIVVYPIPSPLLCPMSRSLPNSLNLEFTVEFYQGCSAQAQIRAMCKRVAGEDILFLLGRKKALFIHISACGWPFVSKLQQGVFLPRILVYICYVWALSPDIRPFSSRIYAFFNGQIFA